MVVENTLVIETVFWYVGRERESKQEQDVESSIVRVHWLTTICLPCSTVIMSLAYDPLLRVLWDGHFTLHGSYGMADMPCHVNQ
jgi:hypothetical protein